MTHPAADFAPGSTQSQPYTPCAQPDLVVVNPAKNNAIYPSIGLDRTC